MHRLLFAILFFFLFFFNASVSAQEKQISNPDDSLKSVLIAVKGLDCANDANSISEKVTQISGVKNCEPVGKIGVVTRFKVSFVSDKLQEEDIKLAIEQMPSCENEAIFPYKVKTEKPGNKRNKK